ncbi:hypothetical protein GCM10028832_14540 [Streptomyces sparsus]
MLTAVFRGHGDFVATAVALTLFAGGIAYVAARARARRPLVTALWAASTVATLSLTLWTTGGAGPPQCVINKDIFEPFGTVQGQLNAGMLVPFGLLGMLAIRRPSVMVSLSILFPALIETAQGLVPFISRLCDTSDLIANTSGALCGVVIGAFVNRRDWMVPSSAVRVGRSPLIGCGVLAGVLAGSWLIWMEPVVMDRTVSHTVATTAQKAAVEEALRDAFGGHYTADSVDFTPGEGNAGSIMAQFSAGAAELSWPDGEQLSVHLIPGRVEQGHTFPVPGISGPVRSDEDAERVAVAYARQFAPWGLSGSETDVQRVDGREDLGWLVSWRRWDGDVLLPMRLDVVVDSDGHVSDLISRKINDPKSPPKVNVPEQQAWEPFGKHFGQAARHAERSEPTLLAARRGGARRDPAARRAGVGEAGYRLPGRVQVFSRAGADQAFPSVTGGEARLADLHVTIAALLVAHGCDVGHTPALRGTDAPKYGRLARVDQTCLRLATYRAANAAHRAPGVHRPCAGVGRGPGRLGGRDAVRRPSLQRVRAAEAEVLRPPGWRDMAHGSPPAAEPSARIRASRG